MGLMTKPFNLHDFKDIYINWIEHKSLTNLNIQEVVHPQDKIFFERNLSRIFKTLNYTPAIIADKYHKLELCLRHSQSVGCVCLKGLDKCEILHLGSSPQFLILFPLEKVLVDIPTRKEFIDLTFDISFVTFTIITALENNPQNKLSFKEICMTNIYQTSRNAYFKTFFTYMQDIHNLESIPESYIRFLN